METGAITQYIDVAQLVLYAFWAFFAGLIYYLVRENHREGYPMDTGREDGPVVTGWPIPDPKTYKLSNGHEVQAPDFNRPDGQYSSQNTQLWSGAPIDPVGDPLLAGIGPGAWAQRADHPDRDLHGNPLIVPLRTVSDHGVAHQDTDPRGLPVYGADGEVAGSDGSAAAVGAETAAAAAADRVTRAGSAWDGLGMVCKIAGSDPH
jgi:photosynthetic reaction center H subunit